MNEEDLLDLSGAILDLVAASDPASRHYDVDAAAEIARYLASEPEATVTAIAIVGRLMLDATRWTRVGASRDDVIAELHRLLVDRANA